MVRLIRILRCQRGATAIEYALIASLISVAAIGAMKGLGGQLNAQFSNVGNALDNSGA